MVAEKIGDVMSLTRRGLLEVPVIHKPLPFLLCFATSLCDSCRDVGRNMKRPMFALWFDLGCDQTNRLDVGCLLDFCLEIGQTHLDVHLAHVAYSWRCESYNNWPVGQGHLATIQGSFVAFQHAYCRNVYQGDTLRIPTACIMIESKLQNGEPKYELFYYLVNQVFFILKLKYVCI